jgi:hypothetical protein
MRCLLGCFASALALFPLTLALSSPPSGAITVGNGGKYAKLSTAMADTSSNVYFVYAGTYTDTVKITRNNIKGTVDHCCQSYLDTSLTLISLRSDELESLIHRKQCVIASVIVPLLRCFYSCDDYKQ